jgi:hypothetical protein
MKTWDFSWDYVMIQIFSKKSKSIFDLELARFYIDDLLAVSKYSLENHLEHLEDVSPNCQTQDLNSMQRKLISAAMKCNI